ncbi:MAG TPA: 30S ribosomal protein S20 [Clostridiales bacterium]|jgi:small subunit ribosomal protein S20|nr:30S ribosomal protein S20 [Clostridiales bacterium]
MANIKSAKKRIRVIAKKTAANRRVKGHLKAVIKDFDTAISESDLTTAKEKLALAEKRLMQAAAKGAIHKNTASRKVSRMARQFNSTKAE